jgi:outer membrane protein assembly factor BamA
VIDNPGNAISLRIIGGSGKDSIIQTGDKGRFHVYDDDDNFFRAASAQLHLSPDTAIHKFEYAAYEYDKRGFAPSVFYNLEDRLYVGVGYGFTNYKWRKKPFATKQFVDLHYSISQNAISTSYSALFPRLIGGWDLALSAYYDAERWTNFFGLGNETVVTTRNKEYNRTRSEQWFASIGLQKQFSQSTIFITGIYQHVQILHDSERYVAKEFAPLYSKTFETNDYAGPDVTYTYVRVNDSIVPTRGVTLLANAAYVWDMHEGESFQKYTAKLRFYVPLSSKFSLAIKTGVSTVAGNDEVINSGQFYEHAIIGGPDNLKGVRRERFWGKTSFYNSNELRFITDFRTHLVTGMAGLFVFFDNGRVWIPNENSNTLHTGYGVGMLLAPFHAISGSITYGISKDYGIVQLGLNKLF